MRRNPNVVVYDASPAEPFPEELAPDIIDPADEIDPVAFIRGLPAGSSHRLINALAFVENELSSFARFRPAERVVVLRVADDLVSTAAKLERIANAAGEKPARSAPRHSSRRMPKK